MSRRLHADVFLVPGDLTVHTAPANVKTILGSCVGVCLWDPIRHFGGVNHFLLATPRSDDPPDNRFGAVATPRLIQELVRHGAQVPDLRAAVIGGGRPVSALQSTTIGEENVAVALAVLRAHHIRVVRRETGGTHGRKLLFNTFSGELVVRPLGGWPRESALATER